MRKLWAVARTTLREAVRTRTVAVILVAIVAAVGLGPFLLRDTGKLADRAQLVLSYSLTAVGFLLSMLTIFLSTSTLASDLREKRIETVATKPIPRWQILVGKWIAVMVLNVVLLVVSGGASYVLVRHVIAPLPGARESRQLFREIYSARQAADPTRAAEQIDQFITRETQDKLKRGLLDKDFDEEAYREKRRNEISTSYKDYVQLVDEVYTARHTLDPTRPTEQIEQYITREIQEKRKKGQLDEDFNEAAYRRKRRKDLWISFNTLPPGYPCLHKFEGVMPATPDQDIFIRYKLVEVGPTTQGSGQEPGIVVEWVASPQHPLQRGPMAVTRKQKVSLGDYHELTIPASVVSPRNELFVMCINRTNEPDVEPADVYAAFPAEEGLQLLYKAGTFEGNFVRAMLLVLARLAFLSALALAAAALLTFPVASLLVLFVFMCALSVDHFMALALPIGGTEDAPIFQTPGVYRPLLRALAAAIPNFGRYDGARELATGRLVPWRLVVRGLVVVGALYGGVVMALGCLYFRGRELADAE